MGIEVTVNGRFAATLFDRHRFPMVAHLVRVGLMGQVGRFLSADSTVFPRGRRVVCRTRRGLEIGEVLGVEKCPRPDAGNDGTMIRLVTAEDDLLVTRLERHKDAALEACAEYLTQRGIEAVLLDAEPLFDGRAVYFYFLGEVTPQIERITPELAEVYESKVQYRKFAQTLLDGCGPGCGTKAGGGCGSTCSSCAVAVACGRRGLRVKG